MLLLGLDILAACPEPRGLLREGNEKRREYLKKQGDWIRQIRNQIKRGTDSVAADMFLDSSLNHANDKKKIQEVLAPIWPQKAFNPNTPMKVNPKLIGKAREWP
jgi:hypothetical protein